jgi:hypothetical protein
MNVFPPAPVVTALLFVLLGACTGRDSPDSAGGGDVPAADAGTGEPAAMDDVALSCETLPVALLRARPTRAGLRARFGEPDSIAVDVEPNRHVRDAVDSLFIVRYDGLHVAIRKPQGGDDMTESVEVSDNRFLRFPDVGIGATAATLEGTLGEPTERADDRLIYDCGMGTDEPTTFFLRDGRVTRIRIDHYVD